MASEREEMEAMLEAEQRDETARLLDPIQHQWRASELPDLRSGSPELPTDGQSACRLLESSIKDSYYKAHRTVELQRQSNSDIYESMIKSPRVALSKANHRSDPFFSCLEENSVYLPKGESALRAGGSAYGGGADRFSSDAVHDKYAAPATSSYDKPYYSRRTTGDPDYYDYDLESSVNSFKATRPFAVGMSHDPKEMKAVNDLSRTSGLESLSGRMFMDGDNPGQSQGDARFRNSSYLSCALRTPDFWTRRFENLLTDTSPAAVKANDYRRQSNYTTPRKYPWELRAEAAEHDEYRPLLVRSGSGIRHTGGGDGEDSDSDYEFEKLKPSPAARAAASRAVARNATEEAIETAAMITPSKSASHVELDASA